MRQKKKKKIGGGSCPPGKCFFLGGGKCPNLGVVNVRILGVVNVLLANDSQSSKHWVFDTFSCSPINDNLIYQTVLKSTIKEAVEPESKLQKYNQLYS